jgi:hypothetical protein
MNIVIKKVKLFLLFFGFDPRIFIYNIIGVGWFFRDYFKLKKELKGQNNFQITKFYPVLKDKYAKGGSLTDHYFYQDLFVANKIYLNNPIKHVDIGSRIDGFVTHVASFRNIEVYDIRNFSNNIQNIKFTQADLTKLDDNLIESTDSISCLHAIEHFGLGRYGDSIDINGHIKGLNTIYSILKKNGKFYFSTPIGKQRIEFNAHRVFSLKYLINYFKENYEIESFSYINDKNEFFQNIQLNEIDVNNNYGCKFGCGIFELRKIK